MWVLSLCPSIHLHIQYCLRVSYPGITVGAESIARNRQEPTPIGFALAGEDAHTKPKQLFCI